MGEEEKKKEKKKKKTQDAQPAKREKTTGPLGDKPDKTSLVLDAEAAKRFAEFVRTVGSVQLPPILPDIASLTLPKLEFPMLSVAGVGLDLIPHYSKLTDEIVGLRRKFEEQARALGKERASGEEKERHIQDLENTLSELRAKERLGFLLNRVNQDAQKRLLQSQAFQHQFLETKECFAFVMAVDIRRSTELMLKARTPEGFAEFITTLCGDLMRIIVDSYGVFDKFTGDGVLAFFPDFYSGPDAAYYAVAVADKCHAAFENHYHGFRKSFSSILMDIGLGIGIDYGTVHLLQVAGGLTVVGVPVVYACRLSRAPSGMTLANQPAYEVISDRFGGSCFVAERELEIKHEGRMLAYEVKLNSREYKPAVPDWLGDMDVSSAESSPQGGGSTV